MPALRDTVPAPDDVADSVTPAPEDVRARSRLSTAGDDVREEDKSGRDVELRLPAPTDKSGKDVRDAPADKESVAKEPLDKKAAFSDGDSAGSAAAPSNAPVTATPPPHQTLGHVTSMPPRFLASRPAPICVKK